VGALSDYASRGDSEKLNQLKQLGGEFKQIAEKASGEQTDKQVLIRHTLVSAMSCALDYWELSSGKSKFAFAEESGLWRVYLDRSTLQTRTLDKYLRMETLPKTPRWRTVLSSLDFILDACHSHDEKRKELEQLRFQLNKLVAA
jgi:two-component system sensor histidine kinase ChiS